MQSKLVSASILAIAALSSASSFAGDHRYPEDPVSVTSGKTRADVRAELLQAQREGYKISSDSTYPAPDSTPAASTKTRAEVRAELLQAQREGYKTNVDNTYPALNGTPVASSHNTR
ncbi:MAG: DUF4148 domain-containing protein [Polaromonas sp.]